MLPKKNKILDLRQLRDQIGPDDNLYMKRRQYFSLRIGCKIIQLRMNTIFRADADPNPHTHPMAFLSFIVRGSYFERYYAANGLDYDLRFRSRWSLAYRSRKSIHNIIAIDGPVQTLFLAIMDTRDPEYGKWGFMVRGKFVSKKDYFSLRENSDRRTVNKG